MNEELSLCFEDENTTLLLYFYLSKPESCYISSGLGIVKQFADEFWLK